MTLLVMEVPYIQILVPTDKKLSYNELEYPADFFTTKL